MPRRIELFIELCLDVMDGLQSQNTMNNWCCQTLILPRLHLWPPLTDAAELWTVAFHRSAIRTSKSVTFSHKGLHVENERVHQCWSSYSLFIYLFIFCILVITSTSKIKCQRLLDHPGCTKKVECKTTNIKNSNEAFDTRSLQTAELQSHYWVSCNLMM